VASAWFSMQGPVLVAFVILSFHCAHDLGQGLVGGCGEPWGADLHEDAENLEAKCTSDEETLALRERERERSACHWWGSETAGGGDPHRFGSSDEGGVEREATLPSSSSLR
jgi:hypothetical protein